MSKRQSSQVAWCMDHRRTEKSRKYFVYKEELLFLGEFMIALQHLSGNTEGREKVWKDSMLQEAPRIQNLSSLDACLRCYIETGSVFISSICQPSDFECMTRMLF